MRQTTISGHHNASYHAKTTVRSFLFAAAGALVAASTLAVPAQAASVDTRFDVCAALRNGTSLAAIETSLEARGYSASKAGVLTGTTIRQQCPDQAANARRSTEARRIKGLEPATAQAPSPRSGRSEAQRYLFHAIAQSGRLGAIVEDVARVPAAGGRAPRCVTCQRRRFAARVRHRSALSKAGPAAPLSTWGSTNRSGPAAHRKVPGRCSSLSGC